MNYHALPDFFSGASWLAQSWGALRRLKHFLAGASCLLGTSASTYKPSGANAPWPKLWRRLGVGRATPKNSWFSFSFGVLVSFKASHKGLTWEFMTHQKGAWLWKVFMLECGNARCSRIEVHGLQCACISSNKRPSKVKQILCPLKLCQSISPKLTSKRLCLRILLEEVAGKSGRDGAFAP